MSTLTSADLNLTRPSTKVHAAPGGDSTFSLSYDAPAAAPKTPAAQSSEAPAPTTARGNLTVQESAKANKERGQTSNIFSTEPTASAPATSRSAKGGQSSITFGASEASTITPRSNKLGESSIEFGASEPPKSTTSKSNKTSQSSISLGITEPEKHVPKITPTSQSSIQFGASDPAQTQPTPKTTNKSLVSTINLGTEEGAAPTSARPNSRQAPGGRSSIVLG